MRKPDLWARWKQLAVKHDPRHRMIVRLVDARVCLFTLPLVAALGYAIFIHLTAPVLPEDDAYITYRYVENVFRGNGLVYNSGERVFGISTPLYAAWLLVLRFVSPNVGLPLLAVRTNLVWYLSAASATAFLLYRLTGQAAISSVGGAIVASNPRMLDISLAGMESFLFAALVLAGLAVMSADRARPSALFVGLAAVTRPEGLLVGLVWCVWWLLRTERDSVALVIAALPLLSWTVFATFYYGTPIPHSLVAKNAPLYLITAPEAAGNLFLETVQWYVPSPLLAACPIPAVFVGLLASVSGVWVVLRHGDSRDVSGWMPVISTFLLISALYCTPGVRLFSWYLPVLWLLWLSSMLGAASRLLGCTRSWWTVIPAGVLFLVAVSPSLATFVNTLVSEADLPFEMPYRSRVLAYQRCAEQLNATARPGATIMATEIGALGYYYNGYIHDTAALVSPHALQYLPIPLDERPGPASGAVRLGFVQDVQPDYVVAMPEYTRRTLKVSTWFAEHYELVATVPLPQEIMGNSVVEVFGCSAPCSTPVPAGAP
jgi:hypothetical protein